jgi:uncharacterized membrane protein YdjX (TVP38/TMEM64 family)
MDICYAYSMLFFRKQWRGWRLKNTALLLAGAVAFFFLAKTPEVQSVIQHLGYLGYAGAFLAGIFFVSTYTVLPASYVLFELAKYNSPLEVAIFAGAGAMLGDFAIFRFIRDGVFDELRPYLRKLGNRKLRQLFRTPYFAWMLPVTGALIIASPFPDELGVTLLGLSRVRNIHFLIVTYLLNAAGIFLIVLLAQSVQR